MTAANVSQRWVRVVPVMGQQKQVRLMAIRVMVRFRPSAISRADTGFVPNTAGLHNHKGTGPYIQVVMTPVPGNV